LGDFPASFTDLRIRSEASYLRSVSTDGRPVPEYSEPAPVGGPISNMGELITEIRVPRLPWARRSVYLKIRDRESYEFALASVAVALDVDANNIALGAAPVGRGASLFATRCFLFLPGHRDWLPGVAVMRDANPGRIPLIGFSSPLGQREIVGNPEQ
jgi:hypothetical protein